MDLKLSDLLRYYLRDSQAAKDLLYRRARSLADYENANKVLDKARMKNKEVKQAEGHQQLCCHRFEKLSGSAKQGTGVLNASLPASLSVSPLNKPRLSHPLFLISTPKSMGLG
ncbi:sorting nexin-32-like, partial [Polyodon spathula]|uniref:sorting nexin-32-like n=1 Tax=Polyodon spathula TaxID=7913 RepID=UPI001B7DD852